MPKTLFVMDPLDRINVSGDSTYMMMLEARRRGWRCWCCTPGDLFAREGAAWARAAHVEVQARPPHFLPAPSEDRPLGAFDVVWMRKDPPFDIDYIFTTYLLELAPQGTLVLNTPASLRSANEKMFAQQWPGLGPPTLVTSSPRQALRFAAEAPDRVVLKPWDGNGGRGVLVSRHGDPNLPSMLELLTGEGRRYLLVQHYVPEIATTGDKRIILVEGRPVGWMARVPQAGDHRGNMHVGARVSACELTARDREICDAIGPRLVEMGLVFTGIDVIGPYLTEINVTSPTGIQEINRLLGTRIERTLADAVLARLETLRGER